MLFIIKCEYKHLPTVIISNTILKLLLIYKTAITTYINLNLLIHLYITYTFYLIMCVYNMNTLNIYI